jgi:hypothetical protein
MTADGSGEGFAGSNSGDQARMHLLAGMTRSGMSYRELWWRQVAVGGDASPLELEAYLLGLLRLDPYQHDLIAQALNEHFLEQGDDHPVPYSDPFGYGRRED